jgi:hypothetical protein
MMNPLCVSLTDNGTRVCAWCCYCRMSVAISSTVGGGFSNIETRPQSGATVNDDVHITIGTLGIWSKTEDTVGGGWPLLQFRYFQPLFYSFLFCISLIRRAPVPPGCCHHLSGGEFSGVSFQRLFTDAGKTYEFR